MIAWVLGALITIFMVGTVAIAIWQESIGWGWWWTLPLGALFVAGLIGFRLLMQRADEKARLRDAELDRLEREFERSSGDGNPRHPLGDA